MRKPQLRDQNVLIPMIPWCCGSKSLIPQFGDQNGREGHCCGISMFWCQEYGDQSVAQDTFDPMILRVLRFHPQNSGIQKKAKATAAGSECFDPQYWEIKVSRRPLLIPWSCGAKFLIPTSRRSKWCESHSCGIRMAWSPWSHDVVDLNLWSPQFGDQNGREGHCCGISMFWRPEYGDQSVAEDTFDPMILWVLRFDPQNSGIKKKSKGHSCGIRMFWSPVLGDQSVAQAIFGPMIMWI